MSRIRRPALMAGLVLTAFAIAACAPPAPPAMPSLGQGVLRVGSEISPGVYSSPADGHADYAARLDGNQDIISNQYADRVLIEVKPTDTYVELDGTFLGYQPRPITPPPAGGIDVDGTWVVNTEVTPGTYRLLPTDGSAYWARLGDANGDNILANDYQNGQTYITVQPGDFAVELSGRLMPA